MLPTKASYLVYHLPSTVYLAYIFVATIIITIGCSSKTGAGTLHLYLSADIRSRSALETLSVEMARVGVQPANRPIHDDWITAPAHTTSFDLLALTSAPAAEMGSIEIPAGKYHRVWAELASGKALNPSRENLPLVLTVEPIAIPFDIRAGDNIPITIELIAMPQTDGGYELFTKSAAFKEASYGPVPATHSKRSGVSEQMPSTPNWRSATISAGLSSCQHMILPIFRWRLVPNNHFVSGNDAESASVRKIV